jgi:toxin FitB
VFLLDTTIVSEVRKPRPNPSVQAWFEAADGRSLFLSVLVLGEIARWIAIVEDRDAERAKSLRTWLDQLRTGYHDRLLPVDVGVAEAWGRMTARRTVPAVDGLLAATAKHHGMTLVTRNTADVADLDVPVLNPFG